LPLIYCHDAVDSTHAEALRLLGRADFPGGDAVVCAGEQTRGRGKGESVWHTGKGGAAVSLLAEADAREDRMRGFAVIVAALAAHDAFAAMLPDSAKRALALKWPNDVFLAGRKMAGILTQHIPGVHADNRTGKGYYNIGVGANFRYDAPVPHAGSMGESVGKAASLPGVASFAQALYAAWTRRYRQWREEGTARLSDEWTARRRRGAAWHEGVSVRIAGLAEDGALRVVAADGAETEIRDSGLLRQEGAGAE
jgi:BirA family biotin operon repressor/biotin-[acetyl-CoA-carboxylase] ligase